MKKTMKKIQTWLNYVNDNSKIEKVTYGSQTIQDHAYSVQEILEKYTRGISLGIQKLPIYDDTQDFDDIDITSRPDLDLVDVHEELNKTKQKIRDLKQRTKDAKEVELPEPSGASKRPKEGDGVKTVVADIKTEV